MQFDAAQSTPHAWLSVIEAAAAIRVGPRTLYKAIRRGQLKAARVNGRDLRIQRGWLQEWAEQQSNQAV